LSVLVVGGNKHDQRKRRCRVLRPFVGQRGGRFQAREAGHANVEEAHRGPLRQRLLQRRFTIADDGVHVQLGPQRGQIVAQRLREQGFVFGDQCGERGGVHAGIGNHILAITPLLPLPGCSSSRASLP
jgi:hypothetical protein